MLQTVNACERQESADRNGVHPLETVHLGDVVVLPDGRQTTARARVKLPTAVGSMAGFVICGELEGLLSMPLHEAGTVYSYDPLEYLPEQARRARAVFSGATSYWSPHLPGQRQAMGELLWKVLELPGSVDPIVIVWRGPEAVIFMRGQEILGRIGVLYMPRDAEDVSNVEWRQSEVQPGILAPDDQPAKRPTRQPAQQPAYQPDQQPAYQPVR